MLPKIRHRPLPPSRRISGAAAGQFPLLGSRLSSKSQKPKDLKDIAGNFSEAASVFSKKLRKWRQKQTAKKPESGDGKRVDRNIVSPIHVSAIKAPQLSPWQTYKHAENKRLSQRSKAEADQEEDGHGLE
nr:UPF0503 protein At3g09070, chloroplastic-like [Ipomoea batatas]